MRAERKPRDERSEQEGARVKPREAEGGKGGAAAGTLWKQRSRKLGWQGRHRGCGTSAGGQRVSCIICVSSLNKCL